VLINASELSEKRRKKKIERMKGRKVSGGLSPKNPKLKEEKGAKPKEKKRKKRKGASKGKWAVPGTKGRRQWRHGGKWGYLEDEGEPGKVSIKKMQSPGEGGPQVSLRIRVKKKRKKGREVNCSIRGVPEKKKHWSITFHHKLERKAVIKEFYFLWQPAPS